MNKLISKITSLWKIWWKNLWLAKKAENILSDWFDLSTANEIWEEELMKIFSNRFTPGTLPFFIISSQGSDISKRKFDTNDTEICYISDWFGLIRPNDSSHIVIPSESKWISFNAKKWSFVHAVPDWKVWELWWWTFQFDKNLGKEIIHTQVSIESMQTRLTQALS